MAGRLSRAILLLPALLLFSGAPAAAQPPRQAAVEAQLLADASYYPALLAKIRTAQTSIDLAMYLWKMPAANRGRSQELVRALGEARRRGVAVRVILENSGYDDELNRANRETAARLQGEGITVFFDSAAVTTHAKLAVIDHRFCFIGSHNLTQSALWRNREISVMFDNPRLAGELGTYLEELLRKP